MKALKHRKKSKHLREATTRNGKETQSGRETKPPQRAEGGRTKIIDRGT
jgi:hypothetical protein